MFSFFKSKPPIVSDLAWLGVDIHSHLLPGIDDGAPDLATSLHLINKLQELGLQKFTCTPHIFKELYPNTPATINAALNLVKQGLQQSGSKVQIAAAAEYMVDGDFEIASDLLCLKDKYILVEMSYLNETPNIDQIIFDLQIKGYKIVLAHPERYNFYHQAHDRYYRLKDMGCLFQLNLLSVTGYYGKPVKLAAEYLLKNNLYDLAGTDLHHEQHLRALESAVKSGKMHEKIGNYPFKNSQF